MRIFTLILSGIVFITLSLALAPQVQAKEKILNIGSGRSVDRIILGKLFIRLLEDRGFSCVDMTGLGSDRLVRSALLNKQIDLYPAYTGEVLARYPDENISGNDPQTLFTTVSNRDLSEKGLVWLDMMAAEKIPRLWLKARLAKVGKLTTISDLAAYVKRRSIKPLLGLTSGFLIAENGYRPLASAYGLTLPGDRVIKMDRIFLYPAIMDNGVSVVIGRSIDWEPIRYGLAHLNDDLGFFRPHNPSAVVRIKTAEKYQDLKPIVSVLSDVLTSAEMAALIGQVQGETDPTQAVTEWLRGKGLIAN